MKLYIIIIQPQSAFGTPLKGDTIFGQFCWQAAESETLTHGLDHWISCYYERPFAVFSSAFPVITKDDQRFYAMPRPFLPISLTKGQKPQERAQQVMNLKKDKKKKYLLVGNDLKPVLSAKNYCSEKELCDFHLALPNKLHLLDNKNRKFYGMFSQAHNTLNRLTGTTGTGQFAPFSADNIHFLPEAKLAVFALINEEALDKDRLRDAFKSIGTWGFGRDASAGLGRFGVVDIVEEKITASVKHKACYTLAPCVPEKNGFFTASFFTPFTRFGKHGPALVHKKNPFKNPVLMADEGAIFIPAQALSRPYIGTAVNNLSKADKRTVMQGYSIFLPCDIEVPA